MDNKNSENNQNPENNKKTEDNKTSENDRIVFNAFLAFFILLIGCYLISNRDKDNNISSVNIVYESAQYSPAEKIAIIEKEKQKLFYEMEKQYIDKIEFLKRENQRLADELSTLKK